jgi:hypothetical protein
MTIFWAAEQMEQGFTVHSVSAKCMLRYDPHAIATTGTYGKGHIRYVRKHPNGTEETHPWKPSPSQLLATDYELVL